MMEKKSSIWRTLLVLATLLLGVGAVAAEPRFTHNSPTADQTLSTSTPSVNVTVLNATTDTGIGNISYVRIWLKNLTYVFNSYLINGTNWTNNGNHWVMNFTSSNFSFRNGTDSIIGSQVTVNSTHAARVQGLTVSNATANTTGHLIFTFDSNFTALTPGLYSLFFSAASTSGQTNDTQSTGTYINFTIGGASVSDLETYLDNTVLSGATSNFRNAANDADASGDILTTSSYSLAVTITADSTVLTIGNFTVPTWNAIGSISPTASGSVGSANDPSDAKDFIRAWLAIGSFLPDANISWARAQFLGTKNKGYTLGGSVSSPTWTETSRYCDSMTTIMTNSQRGSPAETLPCLWRPGDGNTYVFRASLSGNGAAVGDNLGGGFMGGGGGGGYYVPPTVAPSKTTAPEQGEQNGQFTAQNERGWFYNNAGLVVLAAIIIVGIYFLIGVTGSKPRPPGGRVRNRRRN